jgi:PAS domain S-box-containing protein
MKSNISLDDYIFFAKYSPISIILLDLNHKVININAAVEKILDLKLESIKNKKITEITPFSSEKVKEIFEKLELEGINSSFGPKDVQFKFESDIKWLKFTISPIKIDGSQYIQIFLEDITSNEKLEMELRNTEQRYQIFTEGASDLITVMNPDFIIEYINAPIHEKKMGYKEEELIKTNPINIIHPQDLNLVTEAFKDVLKYGEGRIIARIKHKNGHYIWYETTGRAFQDEEGNQLVMTVSRDITDRIKNETKLKESQQRYRDLANTLPEVIFEVDLNYNLTYTNLVASKVFGYSHEDFVKGLTVFDFLHSEEKDEVLKYLKKLYNGEQVGPELIRLRKKDGSYINTRVFASPIIKNAEVIGIRSIIHDITEMKKAQEKIEESEMKFRTIAEQSLLGICIIQDEKIKYINNILANLLEYSGEEMKNWKTGEFFKTIHPSDKKMIIELATAADDQFKNGIRSYEARAIKKSGKIIWLEVYYKKIIYEEKPAYLISFLDITEKKEARQRLKESEEKYRFLFENAPFGIILIDKSGRVKECNPAVEKLIGFNQDEIVGKKYSKLLVVNKEQLPLLLERLGKIGGGESLPPLDIQLRRKDGAHLWVNIESSLMTVGNDVFIIVMGHDISEKKEAEQKLKELDEMRKEFIDRASHELKTPITTVYGAYQLLNTLYRDRFEKEELELLEMAFTGTKRLKKLVDDLLDVSKIESRMFKLEKQSTNLSNIIKKCVSELSYLIKQKNQNLQMNIPEELIVMADVSRIELVITNLLTNSIKYTPMDGQIWLTLKKLDNIAEFSIRDTGIGLSKDEIQELFKKFTKIANPQNDRLGIDLGSTGLGLHIASEIIHLHNGTLKAESPGKNKGSTFTIQIPIKNV